MSVNRSIAPSVSARPSRSSIPEDSGVSLNIAAWVATWTMSRCERLLQRAIVACETVEREQARGVDAHHMRSSSHTGPCRPLALFSSTATLGGWSAAALGAGSEVREARRVSSRRKRSQSNCPSGRRARWNRSERERPVGRDDEVLGVGQPGELVREDRAQRLSHGTPTSRSVSRG